MSPTNREPGPTDLAAWEESLVRQADGLRSEISAKQGDLTGVEEKINLVRKLRELDAREGATKGNPNGADANPGGSTDPRPLAKGQDLEAAIVEVLRQAGAPLHISEIRAALIERRVPIPGRGDEANIIVRLRRLDEQFTRTARHVRARRVGPRTARLYAQAPAEEAGTAVTNEPVSNSDVFLWALYDLRGADTFVDVENVFIRAFELAPLRLSWRTRPDLPDLKKCSKALRDAEGRQPRLLVKQGAEMRQLTVDGQQWIEDNFDRLAEALGRDRVVQPPRTRGSSRLVRQVVQSAAFSDWEGSGTVTEEKWQIAEMLRCSPDSSRAVFRERLEAIRGVVYSAGRIDVLDFLDALAKERADWF